MKKTISRACCSSARRRPVRYLIKSISLLTVVMTLPLAPVTAQRAVSIHNALPKTYFNNGGFIYVDSQVFDDSVNVGIGIMQPQEKLHVAGNILADGPLISHADAGTPPVQVMSNALCSSLNCDYVDGMHGSAFSLDGHSHPEMLVGAGIPTRIAFYGTSGMLSCSPALFWDNPQQRLGIGTDQPAGTLHIQSATAPPVVRITEQYTHDHFGPQQADWDLLSETGQFKLNRIINNTAVNVLKIQTSAANSVLTLNGALATRSLRITQGAIANFLLTADANGNVLFKDPALLTGWTVSGNNVYKTNGVASVGTTGTEAKFNIATTGQPGLIVNTTQATNAYGILEKVNPSTKALAVECNGTERLTIQGDGYLRVDNTIRAREVEVLVNVWQDRVFGEDYALLPLHELEQYIRTHRHLPEVPAEAEVLQTGISLGTMNSLLLQKVEELTLYLIDLNKKTEALQQEVNALRQGQQH